MYAIIPPIKSGIAALVTELINLAAAGQYLTARYKQKRAIINDRWFF